MKRIHWQGASRANRLQVQLGERLQAWAGEWGGQKWRQALASPVDAAAMVRIGGRQNWWFSAPDGAAMWISAEADAGRSLAASALDLGAILGHGLDLVGEVGKRCLAALQACLWGSAELPGAGDLLPEQLEAFEPRRGGLAWRISHLPGDFQVAVNDTWCAARLPHDQAVVPGPGLVDRRTAVIPTRVRVDATIELGSIELLDSLQLRTGEVLLTDVSRQPVVTLSTPSGRLRTGRIVPDRARRTIVLD